MSSDSNSSSFSPFTQLNDLIAAATAMGSAFTPALLELVERSTETVGRVATPIAENPLVQYATQIPGVRWLLSALGQVNVQKAEQDVAELQRQYPAATPQELAQRIISETAFKAAGIGLITNFAPPFAIGLLAVDIAAVTALQAEMVYRIAALYGFSLTDPTRRGEILALWGLSMGGSGVIKAGLSLVEAIPVLGTGIGIASNSALLYSLGYVAVQFYEAKLVAQTSAQTSAQTIGQ
ncbi:MAG: EcsC family protein [Pegethrix bostrychoides GSE-TBD4-15B]|jgi:uncharacterized protein (DUF697 family)|uniref:EcsC family protein n=1 Tax=Pegethrix bostrychoides GSE-TBD4-15B TaxID=2839662 RepID=A0A951U784_9CYAN|nr:EcsC family protein [Pegethrix bostrychoides GSE-TBD4-15B]